MDNQHEGQHHQRSFIFAYAAPSSQAHESCNPSSSSGAETPTHPCRLARLEPQSKGKRVISARLTNAEPRGAHRLSRIGQLLPASMRAALSLCFWLLKSRWQAAENVVREWAAEEPCLCWRCLPGSSSVRRGDPQNGWVEEVGGPQIRDMHQ
jgi:hypothetical protein